MKVAESKNDCRSIGIEVFTIYEGIKSVIASHFDFYS